MPRRPAPVQPKRRKTRKLTKAEAGELSQVVQAYERGDRSWKIMRALEREAARLLGISQGKTDTDFRAGCPNRREIRMSLAVMDRGFDSHGRRAS